MEAWELSLDPNISYPVLLIWCDNTSVGSWIQNASPLSPKRGALGCSLCCYFINSPVSLHSCHISGKTNIIVDRISRTHNSRHDPNFLLVLKDIPQLYSCRRYCTNPALVSVISLSLCPGLVLDPTKSMPKGHFDPTPGGF